jgi:hypothetical protein
MFVAGITAVTLVDAGRQAWQGVKAVKATAQVVKRYRRAPGEMEFAFQLCACLLEALPVAEALATRHKTLAIVGAAVMMARQAAQQAALMVDDTIDDTEEGWAEWMQTGRKLEDIKELQTRLALAISSLQLALAAVQASGLSLAGSFATSPFAYVPDAFEVAHSTLQQMEMGRTRSLLLCGGELWQRGLVGRATGGKATGGKAVDAMRLLFASRVRLHRGSRRRGANGEPLEPLDGHDRDDDSDDEEGDEEGEGGDAKDTRGHASPDAEGSDALALWFLSCDGGGGDGDGDGGGGGGGGGDDDDGERERVLVLDETVRFRRLWAAELAAELGPEHGPSFLEVAGEHSLCYEFTPSTHYASSRPPTRHAAVTPLVLVFQMATPPNHRGSGGRLAAETFEALVFLALCTRRAASGGAPAALPASASRSTRGGGAGVSGSAATTPRGVPLAATYDPDNPAAFVASLATCVGPLTGLPTAPEPPSKGRPTRGGARAAGGGGADSDDLIVTPMKGLGIS